jgi:hypothetical protein
MNKSTDRTFFLALFAALLMLATSLQADVQLRLDRNRITEGETVTLTFLTDDPKQSLDADFSQLEKDFEILDRRSETQLSIVNGRQAALVRLLLTVEPRRTGQLAIPAISFGAARTQEMVLQVDKAPELEPGAMPPVFIEVEVTPDQGPYYVHAQLGLVVRVFYQQNLTEAAISQPEPSQASVRLLQETPYQAERGGERYRVLERRYAIFPERSGELTLPPMQLSGRLVERRDGSIWQPTVRGRRISVESEALQLQIAPRPATFTGAEWQPARNLNISQQVSSSDALRVGEPVTRTIIIDAVGLEENMIAEPAWPEVPGVRIYPDQPQGISRDDGEWVLGHKEFRYAVVPEHEGELVLPELTVHWWDTANDRQQTAVLPPHTLQVQPSVLVPTAPPATVDSAGPVTVGMDRGMSGDSAGPGYWRWLTLLFAALWLSTVLLFWRQRGSRQAGVAARADEAARAVSEADLRKQLRRACERGDVTAARRALLVWLREFGPGAGHSLLEFAVESGDPQLSAGIYAMDSSRYRPAAGRAAGSVESWDGSTFWSQFDSWWRAWKARQKGEKPPLTDLYATANRAP